MQTPRKLFVNLPVEDLDRSVKFFEALGFEFNPQFTDETATCMLIGEDAYAMLVVRNRFAEFVDKPVADPRAAAQTLISVTASSREEVDQLAEMAAKVGGVAHEGLDQGFMYSRGIEDPDGHRWDVLWMDPAVVAGEAPPEPAAAAS